MSEICKNCGQIEEHHFEYKLCNPSADEGDKDYGKKFEPSEDKA